MVTHDSEMTIESINNRSLPSTFTFSESDSLYTNILKSFKNGGDFIRTFAKSPTLVFSRNCSSLFHKAYKYSADQSSWLGNIVFQSLFEIKQSASNRGLKLCVKTIVRQNITLLLQARRSILQCYTTDFLENTITFGLWISVELTKSFRIVLGL